MTSHIMSLGAGLYISAVEQVNKEWYNVLMIGSIVLRSLTSMLERCSDRKWVGKRVREAEAGEVYIDRGAPSDQLRLRDKRGTQSHE